MSGVNAKVSPSTYVQWYKVIDVWTSAGPVKSASVTRYLCNLPKYGGVGDSPLFWQSILRAAQAGRVFYRHDQAEAAGQCFWGKGTPDDVRNALRIVEDVAIAVPNHPDLKPFRNVLDGDDRIAKVCSTYIGVDCNGFIGNYGVENRLPLASPNLVPNLWENVCRSEKWRSKVEDIKPLDVLIWPHGAHIAIIDSIQGDTFTICQATGGVGPQTSFGHVIAAAKRDDDGPKFLVGNGTGKYGPPPPTLPATVRIKSIGFEAPLG